MLVMRSTISFPNGIGVKFRKYVGPGCSLPYLPLKNNLPVMLVNTSANDQIEFTDVKSTSTSFLFKCK